MGRLAAAAALAALALSPSQEFVATRQVDVTLTEGRGMSGFTAADAVQRIEDAIQRPVDVVVTNMKWPTSKILNRYALEHKEPLMPGNLPAHCEVVGGEFWCGDIARHDRQRLAYAVWTVLSRRLLYEG